MRETAAPGSATTVVRFGRPVSLEDVLALARGEARAVLDDAPGYRARLLAGRRALQEQLAGGQPVYGITTGVGASVATEVPAALADGLARNLPRFHGCGTGKTLDSDETAATVAVRLASLAAGYSAVRVPLLERLCDLLNLRLLPLIPEEGSVGASGDLTPLSYLAALLTGEREASLCGRTMSAAAAHAEAGLEPIELEPRESLALMNGTAVMTGIACIAVGRARALAGLSSLATAVLCDVTHGNPGHFDPRIFSWKPHPGSVAAAWDIRNALGGADRRVPARLQDRYSLRCAPHVIGVLLDAIGQCERILAVEINGVDDNPLVDPVAGDILHGGNFYGGHVAFAMDGLKAAVASLADLMDRQLALLCHPETSDGLPANLVAVKGPESVTHHGFKAMQISASALTAEALKGTMPASAFSRSTESHNQDKVSMGTVAARDCRRTLELTETVASILVLALCQAADLRGVDPLGVGARSLHAAVRKRIPMLEADRRQDLDIADVLELLRTGELQPPERPVHAAERPLPDPHAP